MLIKRQHHFSFATPTPTYSTALCTNTGKHFLQQMVSLFMVGFINLVIERLNFERLELDLKSIHDIASLLV